MEQARLRAIKSGKKTYMGMACRTCGSEERNTKYNYCVICVRKRSYARYKAQMEEFERLTSGGGK